MISPANVPDKLGRRRGAYCLANDRVGEWFEAFIRSFRQCNPQLPLTVIPYDASIFRLQGLSRQYQFEIMEEAECVRFNQLEAVVMGLNRSVPMFRKWASFFGQYDDFIFLDSDTVVLNPIEPILDAFSGADLDLLYFEVDPSVYAAEAIPEMQAKYGSVGFNAGAFVSRKEAITYGQLIELSRKATGERNKFFTAFDVGDQPFMNYVFDVSGRKVAHLTQVLPEFSVKTTARQPIAYNWKNNIARDAAGKIMLLVHWPGCAYPTMVRPRIFLRSRTRGFLFSTRLEYYFKFYLQRYWTFLLLAKARWQPVIVKFISDKGWRNYYFRKLFHSGSKPPV